ncbi:glycosyltransferase family 39 protein [Thermoproteota archaeon]
MSKGPFHMDSFELAINANKTLNEFRLHYMHGFGYPLTVIAAAVSIFFCRLAGVSDPIFGANFMSVVFGSLGIGAYYLLAKTLIGRSGAVLSALALCLLPLHLSISTYAMTHHVSIFFHILGIYFLFLYFKDQDIHKLIDAGILLGFGTAARLSDGMIILPIIILFFVQSHKQYGVFSRTTFSRLGVLLGSYFLLWVVFYLPMIAQGDFREVKGLFEIYYHFHSLRQLSLARKGLLEILGLYGCIFSILGAFWFIKEKGLRIASFLMVWLAMLFLYHGSLSIFAFRYLLFAIVPLFIFQGYLFAKFLRVRSLLVKILFVSLILLNIATGFIEFFPIVYFRHLYNTQEELCNLIQENTEPDSLIISLDLGYFIKYYTGRKILGRPTGFNKLDFDKFFDWVDLLLDKDRSIYINSSAIISYDPRGYMRKGIVERYELQSVGKQVIDSWYKFSSVRSDLRNEYLFKMKRKK